MTSFTCLAPARRWLDQLRVDQNCFFTVHMASLGFLTAGQSQGGRTSYTAAQGFNSQCYQKTKAERGCKVDFIAFCWSSQ